MAVSWSITDCGTAVSTSTSVKAMSPDVYVPCEVCDAKRYNRETLQVTYKDKNIADVLDMDVKTALDFFEN